MLKIRKIIFILCFLFLASTIAQGFSVAQVSYAASVGGDDGSPEDSPGGNSANAGDTGSPDGTDGADNSESAGITANIGGTGVTGDAQSDTDDGGNTDDLSAQYADLTQEEKAEILNRLGILKGDPDIGLMLDEKVRRSEAAVFFTRLLGQEQNVIARSDSDFAETRFPDVKKGTWYTPYVSYCAGIGIFAGRTDGKFYPDETISEKEFANVLLKLLGYVYETDYNWDTVFKLAYEVTLFEDQAYETRTEDKREYYRRDVCDQVFAALGAEKKDGNLLLIEELVQSDAISMQTALDLDFDLSAILNENAVGQTGEPAVDADIYGVYHLDTDLLWVVFTHPVTFSDDAVEICQTYDYSRILSARVEEKTSRDLLLRTDNQQPNMDYTIDIGNVVEQDGANAGMLSFDFVGFDSAAVLDTPAGLTSLTRGTVLPSDNESGTGTEILGTGTPGTGAGSSVGGSSGGGSGAAADATGTGAGDDVTPYTPVPSVSSGNANPSVEYFRIINAYTTAANEVVLYFSHPITAAAANASFYNISEGSTLISSGTSGQITATLQENAVNAVRLNMAGTRFLKGGQYRVSVSGRLLSAYTARLNEGAEDSYTFTADNVTEHSDSFVLKSVSTVSQYLLELEFSQPVNPTSATQTYNYQILDQSNRKMEITWAAIADSTSGKANGTANGTTGDGTGTAGRIVRLSLSQAFLANQSYTLTLIYAQNSAQTASIVSQSYPFDYGGQTSTSRKSPITLTGAISNDAATVDINFSVKPDADSARITSNYSITGSFDGKTYTVTPVKAVYDPILTPYSVRLFMPYDRQFRVDSPYTLKIFNSLRDEIKLSADKTIEMQFFASNKNSVMPALRDAVVVGESVVRLDFSKEILFDPTKVNESNFSLVDSAAGAATYDAGARVSPILVKYVDPVSIILIFDGLDMSRKYTVQMNTMTDYSGAFTLRYPESGSSVTLRAGVK